VDWRDEVAGGWRKLHNEELRNLYYSPGIIRMATSRWMRWTGHVARMGGGGGGGTGGGGGEEEVEDCIYDTSGKTRRKETTWKTKMEAVW
jgi:hypothetical protein